ncbi:MAG: transcriptional regulator [Acidobacteriia bacterium]|nr:transcriptional regulator [Terriglobia bacterium]MYG01335.1 transcriptional regulator [Terriglobia bacterium]MYK09456.1 transcriptional regulator [Terriglobia bacterium]
MEIVPIKTKEDYRRTIKEIEGLMTAKQGTPAGDRLDVLVTLVEAWEARNYPIDLPDPVDAIRYHMEQNGLAPKDLVEYFGSRNRVYEVLNRRRPLSLKMIRRLHQGLGIPAESLIKVADDARQLKGSVS